MKRFLLTSAFLLLAFVAPSWAAAPQSSCTAATTLDGSATAQPRNVNIPTDESVGDLFYAIALNDGNVATVAFPAGWTEVGTYPGPTTSLRITVFYRVSDGTEGSTISVSTSSTETLAVRVYCFSGAADPSVFPPEMSSGVQGSGTSADAPSITPSYGEGDYRVLPIIGIDVGIRFITVSPEGYSYSSWVTDDGGSGDVRLAVANEGKTGSTFDPGVATLSASIQWTAVTTAIPAAVTPAGARRRLILSDVFDSFDLSPIRWFLTRNAHASTQ